MIRRILLFFLFVTTTCLHAQEVQDNHEHSEVAKHNIKRATTLALIPGAGQAYNKKYWKVPLVWGIIGGATYYYIDLDRDFKTYKAILQHIVDNEHLTTLIELQTDAPELFAQIPSPFYQNTATGVGLETIGYMDALRTQREYAFFGIIGVYILSILDANIDAHLFDFDVSDDLSLSPAVVPVLSARTTQQIPGLKLTLALP